MAVKTIILDLGEVIIEVDTSRTEKKMLEFGLTMPEVDILTQKMFEEGNYDKLETGEITEAQLRDITRQELQMNIPDHKLDEAWNEMLRPFPPEHIRLIEELKTRYSVYLLSNTNSIHYRYFNENFCNCYNYSSFEELFDRTYMSYQLGMRKPDPEIFKLILDENRLDPAETLFVDDRIENILSARSLGIQCIHLIDRDLVQALLDY